MVPSPLASTAASASAATVGLATAGTAWQSSSTPLPSMSSQVRLVSGAGSVIGTVLQCGGGHEAGRGDRAAHPEDEEDRRRRRPDRSCEDGCACVRYSCPRSVGWPADNAGVESEVELGPYRLADDPDPAMARLIRPDPIVDGGGGGPANAGVRCGPAGCRRHHDHRRIVSPALTGRCRCPQGRRRRRRQSRPPPPPRGRFRGRSRCGRGARRPAGGACRGSATRASDRALRASSRSAATRSGSAARRHRRLLGGLRDAPRAARRGRGRSIVRSIALEARAPRGSRARRVAGPGHVTRAKPARTASSSSMPELARAARSRPRRGSGW